MQNGSYSLITAGTFALADSSAKSYTLLPNSTIVLRSFTGISCASMALSGSDDVYAFLVKAGLSTSYGPDGKAGYILRSDPLRPVHPVRIPLWK